MVPIYLCTNTLRSMSTVAATTANLPPVGHQPSEMQRRCRYIVVGHSRACGSGSQDEKGSNDHAAAVHHYDLPNTKHRPPACLHLIGDMATRRNFALKYYTKDFDTHEGGVFYRIPWISFKKDVIKVSIKRSERGNKDLSQQTVRKAETRGSTVQAEESLFWMQPESAQRHLRGYGPSINGAE